MRGFEGNVNYRRYNREQTIVCLSRCVAGRVSLSSISGELHGGEIYCSP